MRHTLDAWRGLVEAGSPALDAGGAIPWAGSLDRKRGRGEK